MERKCENCGASLSENEKNCPYCGINEQELLLKKAISKQNNQASTQPNPKKGVFIASCICFALSIIVSSIYIINYIKVTANIASDAPDFTSAFLLLYLIFFGSPFILPSIGLLIATICCSIFSTKSTTKIIRRLSKVILIISIILIFAIVLSVLIPFFTI